MTHMSNETLAEFDRQFNETLNIIQKWCIGKLRARYRNATNEQCVEAAGHAIEKLLEARQRNEPPEALFGYALKCAVNFLNKLLGNQSKHRHETIDFIPELPGLDPIPLEPLLAQERRARQSGALSDTLRNFVKKCEDERSVGLRTKECFERRCFGESVAQIAESMRQYRKSTDPRNQVSVDVKRAREYLLASREKYDVNETLFTRNREEGQQPRPEIDGENPPLTDAALADTMLLMAKLPEARSSIILFGWLVCDTQAYCPSSARLRLFAQWHAATQDPSQANCPDELLDIGYHVLERQCRFCAALLQPLR